MCARSAPVGGGPQRTSEEEQPRVQEDHGQRDEPADVPGPVGRVVGGLIARRRSGALAAITARPRRRPRVDRAIGRRLGGAGVPPQRRAARDERLRRGPAGRRRTQGVPVRPDHAASSGLGWRAMDPLESIYASFPGYNNLSEPLVRVDKDWKVDPGPGRRSGRWPTDGLSWTFNLQPGLMWTNGDEVTADDYVASFQYAADPTHAWDFSWYYDGIIRNFAEAARGHGADRPRSASRSARTSTRWCSRRSGRSPFLPAMLIWSAPLHAKSLAQYGSGVYNIDPATAVTCGPFKLEEFSPDRRVVAGREHRLHRHAQADDRQAGRQHRRPAAATSRATRRARSTASPSVSVRRPQGRPRRPRASRRSSSSTRATSAATTCSSTSPRRRSTTSACAWRSPRRSTARRSSRASWPRWRIPAYTWLMPGFPDADQDGAQVDPGLRRRRGQGAPRRGRLPGRPGVPAADARHPRWRPGDHAGRHPGGRREHHPDARRPDRPADAGPGALHGASCSSKPTKIPFGWVTYGMDYLDATNMLSVWKSGGRHNWNNAEFDKLVEDGGAITNDPAARSKAMKDAERLLVESARRCLRLPPAHRPAAEAVPHGILEGAQHDRLHRRPVARRRSRMTDRLRHPVPGRRRRDHAQGLTTRHRHRRSS